MSLWTCWQASAVSSHGGGVNSGALFQSLPSLPETWTRTHLWVGKGGGGAFPSWMGTTSNVLFFPHRYQQ